MPSSDVTDDDASSYDFDAVDIHFYFYMYKIAVPVLFGLIMLTGIIGNFLVIVVTLTQRKMQSTVNLLLLNLALSDLTFLIVCIPFNAYHYSADNWLIGDAACKISQFLLYVTVYVNVYTLVCISILRFQHIVCSRGGSSVVQSKPRVGLLVCTIWAVMLTSNVPILLIYRVKHFPSMEVGDPYYYCGVDEPAIHGRRLFLSFFVLTYIAPLTTISTMYLLILRYLNAKKACFRQSAAAAAVDTNPRCAERRTSYASRISMAIIVVFGLCWLPLHIHLLVVYFGVQPESKFYQVFRVLCHVLAYSNSCMNPLVYHYVSTDFRQSLRNFCLRTGCGWCFRGSRTDLWPVETALRDWTQPADTTRERAQSKHLSKQLAEDLRRSTTRDLKPN